MKWLSLTLPKFKPVTFELGLDRGISSQDREIKIQGSERKQVVKKLACSLVYQTHNGYRLRIADMARKVNQG